MSRYAFFCYFLCSSSYFLIDFKRIKRFAAELLDLNAVNILEDIPRHGRPPTVITKDTIDTIHDLRMDGQRV